MTAQDTSNGEGTGAATGNTQDSLEQTVDRVVDQTKQVVSDLVGRAQQTAGQVADQTRQTTGQVTGKVIDKMRQQAVSLVAPQKDDTAAILEAAAQALVLTGARLREQDRPNVADSAEQAAAKLDRLSHYLQGHSVDEITVDVERLAGELPATVLAGAVALGLLGARLLNHSEQ